MNTPSLVTGRHGIGPVNLTSMVRRLAFLRRAEIFLRNKEQAITCARQGDRDGARFWGAQARVDWRSLAWSIADPAL